jgi:uncharacterized protein YceK
MKKSIVLAFAVSTVLLAGCCTAHHTENWEYKQVMVQPSDAALNKLADEGWSLVCCSYDGHGGRYVLKRPKQKP